MDGDCNPDYIGNMITKQHFDTKVNQNLNYFIENLDDSPIPVQDQNSMVTEEKRKRTKEKSHPLCTSKVQQNTQHNRLRTLLHSSQLQRKQGLFTVDHYKILITPKHHRPTPLDRVSSSWNRAGRNAPDLLGVLVDGAVAAEFAAASRVQDRHLDPFLLVPVMKT